MLDEAHLDGVAQIEVTQRSASGVMKTSISVLRETRCWFLNNQPKIGNSPKAGTRASSS